MGTLGILPSKCQTLLSVSRLATRQFYRHKTTPPQNFTDYESIKQNYNPQIPKHFNFAKDVLDVWAEREKSGERAAGPALWWVNDRNDEIRWSFEELGFQSRRLANVLAGPCQLAKEDRVFLILPRVPEWWLVNVACLRTGTVLLPGTTQLTARDILHRLQSSGARCVVTDESLAPLLESVAPQCPSLQARILVSRRRREGWMNFGDLLSNASSDHECVQTGSEEPMTIFFTSGTTGSPKMTQHSHSSYGLGLTVNGRYWLDLTEKDVLWNTSDTGWAKSAWSSVFAPWTQGSCVFVHHMPRFDSGTVLKTLSNYPITTFCTAPTAYRMLVQDDISSYSFQALQHCLCAGEPINPEVMDKWKEATGLDIYEGYGQTETVLIAGTFKGMKIKPGSFGKASPAYDVQVVDEAGDVLPRGEEGNLGIRVKPNKPFSLFTAYTGDPKRTAECYRGDFYLTGDRGVMDEDGYLWFVGRADDVILSAGYRIGPFEVENALIEHRAVAESAVVSSPHPIRGEVVKAFVVLTEEYKSHDRDQLVTELQAHVKTVTAPYKYPRKNYSDISEQEVRSVTRQVQPADLVPRNSSSTPEHRGSPPAAGAAPGGRRSLRGRKEPSFKPREEYQPSGVPFQSVTQYKQDFKPWPIPKKENFPWISNGGRSGDSGSDSPPDAAPQTRDQRGAPRWGEQQGTGTANSSYRQEYRAWTGARPAKSSRKPPPALYGSPGQGVAHPYSSPGAGASHLPPETSYQAAFSSGETHRHPELQEQADHTTTLTPTPTLQPISAPLQPSPIPMPCSLQQSSLAERPDFGVSTRGEVQLVKTKLPPNPSAVFQSGPRIFNI